MDLSFSREEEAFRERVRSFIAEHLPAHLKGRTRRDLATKEDYLGWHRTLCKQGWIAPLWPKEYGGTGWSVTERYIFNEECARAETPPLIPFGLAMVGPVIYTFGNQAQKQKFLPRILSGEDWWCQG
jgi:alkylation response protein AidB-like acyl-CoA dehydrogenase